MVKNLFFPIAVILLTLTIGSLLPVSESKNIISQYQPIENGPDLENHINSIGLPIKLAIPSINVNANIQHVGLSSDGSIGDPKGAYDVAWFNASPRPGENGSSIITGHYGQWITGSGSVFDNLDKLKKGDKIYITDENGSLVFFAVEKIRVYNKDESVPDLFSKDDTAYLNLITCYGTWIKELKTYAKRLIVFAKISN